MEFRELDVETEADVLVDWLSSQTWPYHVDSHPSPERVREMIAEGRYTDDDQQTFWIIDDGARVGLVRLLDLDDVDDGEPVFDLRVAEAHRFHGIGKGAVRWLTAYLFERYPDLQRVGGSTRADNHAMRAVFESCGFVQEAQFRKAWRTEGDQRYDAVYYAILRSDWAADDPTGGPEMAGPDDQRPDDEELLVRHARPLTEGDGDDLDEAMGTRHDRPPWGVTGGDEELDEMLVRHDRRLTGDDTELDEALGRRDDRPLREDADD